MMPWPSWLMVGTPLKLLLWLGNRFATWTGLFLLWKRWRHHRLSWVWLVLLNTLSLGLLGLVFLWLHHSQPSP